MGYNNIMASLEEIKIYLNIDINEPLRDGMKNPLKNRYYYYPDQYYIVELSQNKWTILEDRLMTMIFQRLCLVCVIGLYGNKYMGNN